jgi:hypothetical protein
MFILLQNCIQRHKGQHPMGNIVLTQSQHDNGHTPHLQEGHTETTQIHSDNNIFYT